MLKWPKFNPKFFFYTLLTLTCLFTVSVFAQSNLLKDKQNAISLGGNQEAWLSEAFSSNAVAGLQALVGPIPDDVIDGKVTSWIPGGAIGSVNQAIAYTFTPAASGVQYIAQTWDNFLGKPAYAQNNTGFVGLQPILPIWRGFRNVVYILSSLIFIIIGIMIMLRVKISPQAVITVQNAIPQLITTLILVTFSYAIAGLLIDLMSLIQGIILTTLFTASGKNLSDNLLNPAFLAGSNFNDLNNLNLGSAFMLITKNIGLLIILLVGAGIGAAVGVLVAGPFAAIPVVGAPAAALGAGGAAAIGAILFALVVAIMIFVNVLKFLIGLLKAYINIIFKIILAPLEIGAGAFPGSKQGFSSWLFELVGYLAVFPVSIFFIAIINLISESTSSSLWAPSIIGNGGLIGFIIAFGGLLVLPKIPELVPQVFFNLKPSPWSQAADQAMQFKPGFVSGAAATTIGGAMIRQGGFLDETVAGSWAGRHKTLSRLGRAATAAGAQQLGGKIT